MNFSHLRASLVSPLQGQEGATFEQSPTNFRSEVWVGTWRALRASLTPALL